MAGLEMQVNRLKTIKVENTYFFNYYYYLIILLLHKKLLVPTCICTENKEAVR